MLVTVVSIPAISHRPPQGRQLRPCLFVVTVRRRLAVTCATEALVVSSHRTDPSRPPWLVWLPAATES